MLGSVEEVKRRISEDEFKDFLKRSVDVRLTHYELIPKKPIKYLESPEQLVKAVTTNIVRRPVWKIVCPDVETARTGANYYIVETHDAVYVFRGTYGYSGTGPRESALVEKALEYHKIPIEVRSADYMLAVLGLM